MYYPEGIEKYVSLDCCLNNRGGFAAILKMVFDPQDARPCAATRTVLYMLLLAAYHSRLKHAGMTWFFERLLRFL